MRRIQSLTLLLSLLAGPTAAADLIKPNPDLSPRTVVSIQLRALQMNDHPVADAGIAQAWAFAHPENRRLTGPLDRFARMIKGPHYRGLLNHRSHEIKDISRSDEQAVFAVELTSQSGKVLGYRWQVAKVLDGANAGAWMTVGVFLPTDLGDAI